MYQNIIDLSHSIENEMPAWPGTVPPRLRALAIIEEDGYAEWLVNMPLHTGTHIDLPGHMLPEGRTIDKVPIDFFTGKALMVCCDNLQSISRSFVESQIHHQSKIDFLIFNCGWSQYWNTDAYYSDFPVLTKEAVEFIANLDIKGVGFDTPSPDPVSSKEFPFHLRLFSSGKIIIENLTNLDALKSEVFDFMCLPLNIKYADGCPVRAIAMQ